MDLGAIISGGVAGAILGGLVSLWNSSRDRRIDHARLVLERDAHKRQAVEKLWDDIQHTFGEMNSYLNRDRWNSGNHVADVDEFLQKLSDLSMRAQRYGVSRSTLWFVTEAASQFDHTVEAAVAGRSPEPHVTQFVRNQEAVADMIHATSIVREKTVWTQLRRWVRKVRRRWRLRHIDPEG